MEQVSYPDLSEAKVICFDIETYDPGISKSLGPGVYRNDGYILGVGIATEKGFAEYYNVGHYDCSPEEAENNWEYIRKVLALNTNKLGTNLIYDVDWLENWEGDQNKFGWRGKSPKIKVNGLLYDIQIAEPLLNENQKKYSLDFQAKKYLGHGKTDDKTKEFCKNANLKGDPRQWLYKMPYAIVREYVLGDITEPIEIFKIQWQEMHNQDLLPIFNMETKLLRPIIKMRKTGAKIDQNKRDINAFKAQNKYEEILIDFSKQYGDINVRSSKQLSELFTKENIPFNYTVTFWNAGKENKEPKKEVVDNDELEQYLNYEKEGRIVIKTINPSVKTELLEALRDSYPIADKILFLRKSYKMIHSFLMGSLTDYVYNDKIHPSIYSLKNDDYGTVSGRFSMSNPNLQQIPSLSKDKFWGTICRELFIPKENCWWAKIDYSQIEYRILAHYAIGKGSDNLRDTYKNNPETDYHMFIQVLTKLNRKLAKNLNFGVMYGMGLKRMARNFAWKLEYAEEVTNLYHTKAPYVKETLALVQNRAKNKGFIKTLLGRRARLINRDKAYVMFNRKIQGSAADLMKKAILDVYNKGYMDKLDCHITVHDELDFSVPKTVQGIKDLFEVKNIMENTVKLKVPILADIEIGHNWADVSELNIKELGMTEQEWLDSLTDENVVEKVETLWGASLNK